jgi:hypothetical protein
VSALSNSELNEIREQLGYNVLTIGAEPYVWHVRIFDIIQAYVTSDATAATSSSTAVTASGPASLTLALITGISAGTRLMIDADESAEVVTCRSVSGSTISVICQNTHSGTYPVEIVSAATQVRMKLWQLRRMQRLVDTGADSAGIKRADEVEFFGDNTFQNSRTGHLLEQQKRHRLELAALVGLSTLIRDDMAGSGNRFEVY